MSNNHDPKPKERFEDLLEESLKDITVLKEDGKIVASKEPPAPIPTQSIRDEADVLKELLHQDIEEEGAEFLSEEPAYLRSGVQHQVLRKLRRNYWVVQDELDLHGSTSDTARVLVAEFLANAKKEASVASASSMVKDTDPATASLCSRKSYFAGYSFAPIS